MTVQLKLNLTLVDFSKDGLGPHHCGFLMRDSGWLAAKTFEMTPALKPGYNSDRALCLKKPDIWINVWKDLTGFPPSEQVLQSEMDRLSQQSNFILYCMQVTLKFWLVPWMCLPVNENGNN